jgi:hypothetical protein
MNGRLKTGTEVFFESESLFMRARHVFVVLSLALCTTTLCVADDASMSSVFKQFMSAPDSPIILRGDYFKATQVAYQDFAKVIERKAREAQSLASNDRELSSKLAKLENYDISVDQTPSSYIVQFGPTVRDNAHDVFGGGARYVIDRKTFLISEKVGLK